MKMKFYLETFQNFTWKLSKKCARKLFQCLLYTEKEHLTKVFVIHINLHIDTGFDKIHLLSLILLLFYNDYYYLNVMVIEVTFSLAYLFAPRILIPDPSIWAV